jgi:hypothetical protein
MYIYTNIGPLRVRRGYGLASAVDRHADTALPLHSTIGMSYIHIYIYIYIYTYEYMCVFIYIRIY